jgi:RNA ligase
MYAKIVIDYLKSGKTLEDLNTEYGIKSTFSKDGKLVSLNYSQIDSPMGEEICQVCRGLILEVGTWNLISRSFPKFFNYSEQYAANLDEESLKIYDKLDGSLVEIYWYDNKWNVATKGSPDASGTLNTEGKTFSDLIHQTIQKMGYIGIDDFMYLLPKTIFYTFELTTPENQVVIPYNDYKLTLLALFNKDKEYELDLIELPFATKVKLYNFSTLEDIIKASKELNESLYEGYVVVDKNFNRVKIKSPEYLAAHRLVSGLKTAKNVASLCLQENYDDIISLIPEGIKEYVKDSREKITSLIKICNQHYQILTDHLERTGYIDERDKKKRFALIIKNHQNKGILFEMYKGYSAYESLLHAQLDSVVDLAQIKGSSEFLRGLDF